jgi:crossover junction endodeoxyribonuclease RuvC
VIVLGVDPGAATTGYGVVTREGGGAVSLLECGVIRTDSKSPLPQRLKEIYTGLSDVIARHHPEIMAVEGVFYARNARTTVILGHARGAILLAATMQDIPVAEYAPAEIKNAIVGTGRAAKEQVQFMIQKLLRLKTPPQPADAADGVAVALCHCNAFALDRLRTPVRFSRDDLRPPRVIGRHD